MASEGQKSVTHDGQGSCLWPSQPDAMKLVFLRLIWKLHSQESPRSSISCPRSGSEEGLLWTSPRNYREPCMCQESACSWL